MTVPEIWFFDLDGCLVDSMAATTLRPHARELLSALRERGTAVHIWSAGGDEYAERVAARVGIADLVQGYHDKVRVDGGRWRLPSVSEGATAVCVDDQPEGVPTHTRVLAVFPFIGARPHDRALARILAELDEAA